MSMKQDSQQFRWDSLKWILILLLLVAGFGANYYFHETAWALRLAGWIVLAGIIAAIALQTAKGYAFWTFAKESRAELRKVVWPTRQETTQSTVFVIVMVVITALMLWGVDSLLLWAVGLVTR